MTADMVAVAMSGAGRRAGEGQSSCASDVESELNRARGRSGLKKAR